MRTGKCYVLISLLDGEAGYWKGSENSPAHLAAQTPRTLRPRLWSRTAGSFTTSEGRP